MRSKGKRVLITGASGQVGRELSLIGWPAEVSTLFRTKESLDITDKSEVDNVVQDFQPDVIVNAAAYTAVDKAESEHEQAWLVNRKAVEHLAAAADAVGAGFIHLSTDYVFDGEEREEWYCESDTPNPINVYGETKLAGEVAALQAKKPIVLRTSGVFSSHGSNFVRTMCRLAEQEAPLRVVDDQFICPTSASDVAATIVSIINQEMEHLGLFHAVSVSDATWWDLADEALRLAGYDCDIAKLTTEEYPLPAKRPADLRMSSAELALSYGLICPPWRTSLAKVVAEISEKVDVG